MGEIGSEFWDVPILSETNNLFPDNTQWFLSGRSALQAIIGDLKGCRSVAMPSYCCDSMIKPFADAGYDVHFYPVYWQDGLHCEISLDCDVLFLIDYFGYTADVPSIRDYSGVVIRDVTHSLFSENKTDADYYFGSLRKWCGFWTGGFCRTKDGHRLRAENTVNEEYVALRKTAMELKKDFIAGERRRDKGFLQLFAEAEELLEQVGPSPADRRDIRLARKLDVSFIQRQRRANAAILREAFADDLVFREMGENDCPMFVPIFVRDGKRDALRKYLIQQEIYCPIHWPKSDYHRLNDVTETMYTGMISLVCDQRYSEDHMRRIVSAVDTFWKEA